MVGVLGVFGPFPRASGPVNNSGTPTQTTTQGLPTPFASSQIRTAPCGTIPCRTTISGGSLGKFIETEGPPQKVVAFVAPGDEQYQRVSVMLFYPGKGMTIIADKRDTQSINRITPDFEMSLVSYWASTSLDGLRAEFQAVKAPEARWLSLAQDWQGYDSIKIVNPFAR